jgi:outer membrane protein TolC
MRFGKPSLAFIALQSALWGEELDLKKILGEALERSPEIRAAQKRYEALRQRPGQESRLPDPSISAGYNSSGSPRPFAGIGREPTANAGVTVSQEFPYPGKLRLRGAVAGKEAEAAFQDYILTKLHVAARIKRAYHGLHHAYEAEDVLLRGRRTLTTLLKIAEIRYSAGRAAQQDVFKAQTQLSVLETRIAQIARERAGKEAELNGLLDRPPGTLVPRPAASPLPEVTVTLEALLDHARRKAPALDREKNMIERAELAVNLARKSVYPDYTLMGGYFNMGAMPDMYMFRADLKIPLRRDRQRAEVAEKSYLLTGSRRTYEAVARDLEFRIGDDYSAAATAARLVKLYATAVIPQARLAFESSLASYETGGVDFLSALMNHMAVLEFELSYHEEMEKLRVAWSRLEEMTGWEEMQ